MKATQKKDLKLDVSITCKDCGGDAEVRASRKKAKAVVECVNCGVTQRGVFPYGPDMIAGDMEGDG